MDDGTVRWTMVRAGHAASAFEATVTVKPAATKGSSSLAMTAMSADLVPSRTERAVISGEWLGRIAARAEGVPYTRAFLGARGGGPHELR